MSDGTGVKASSMIEQTEGDGMVTFLIIGGVGIVLLVASLIFGDLFDFDTGFEFGGFGADVLSTAGFAGLVGGFGFGGALALDLFSSKLIAIIVGVCVGLLLAFGASWLTRALKRGEVTASSTKELVGRECYVLSSIPADGYGQVRISYAGQTVTLNAKSERELQEGRRVWITGVLSPTAVEVEPIDPDPI